MARFNPLKPTAPIAPARPDPLAKGVIPAPPTVSHAPVLTENDKKDGLELRFPTRPGEDVLAQFHATRDLPVDQRWHWHRRGHYWYARRNDATRALADKILGNIQHPTSNAEPRTPAPEEKASNIVAANPIALADALKQTAALNDNVIEVNFAAATVLQPSVTQPSTFIPPRPALPAWRARMRGLKP